MNFALHLLYFAAVPSLTAFFLFPGNLCNTVFLQHSSRHGVSSWIFSASPNGFDRISKGFQRYHSSSLVVTHLELKLRLSFPNSVVRSICNLESRLCHIWTCDLHLRKSTTHTCILSALSLSKQAATSITADTHIGYSSQPYRPNHFTRLVLNIGQIFFSNKPLSPTTQRIWLPNHLPKLPISVSPRLVQNGRNPRIYALPEVDHWTPSGNLETRVFWISSCRSLDCKYSSCTTLLPVSELFNRPVNTSYFQRGKGSWAPTLFARIWSRVRQRILSHIDDNIPEDFNSPNIYQLGSWYHLSYEYFAGHNDQWHK